MSAIKTVSKTFRFPDNFFFGTSSAATQIETASNHNWRGEIARDGEIFNRTCDHELRRAEDAQHIARFGTIYRCSIDWARIQTAPSSEFNAGVVKEYAAFFDDLQNRGMKLMLVLHHFTQPIWFENLGGWENKNNIAHFIDYTERIAHHFSKYVAYWNTFNEPNVYAMNGWILGTSPPHVKNYFKANKILRRFQTAHDIAFQVLRHHTPNIPIGISLNTALFEGKNFLGKFSAAFVDWWFNKRAMTHFKNVDFLGISYYAHILFDPFPISEIHAPGKLGALGIPHDGMWGYNPEGLSINMRKLYARYKKPLIITENGICTDDDNKRISAIKDYLSEVHAVMQSGIPVLGYIFWSTFDNFEWDLGKAYRFGLLRVDFETCERKNTAAAEFYQQVCETKSFEL